MTKPFPHQSLNSISVILIGLFTTTLAVSTQVARADEFTLSGGFSPQTATGQTVGSYHLANISNRDTTRRHNLCLGYGTAEPDHIMTLQQDFETLTVAVDSGGADTTLLIQGPNDNTIRCNNDGGSSDASITDAFQAGSYRIWVGGFDPGATHNYTLLVTE